MSNLLIAVCLVLGVAVVYFFTKSRQVNVYKELYESADVTHKKSQEEIRDLLEKQSDTEVLLERGAQILEKSNAAIEVLENERLTLQQSLEYQQQQYDKLFHQKKSSEVRTGKIAEQMAPFLKDYPLDSKTGRFLGDPIDFVHFEEDKVTFVEVKSGKAQLNKKQRQIRDLINEGKVDFVIYRVEGAPE